MDRKLKILIAAAVGAAVLGVVLIGAAFALPFAGRTVAGNTTAAYGPRNSAGDGYGMMGRGYNSAPEQGQRQYGYGPESAEPGPGAGYGTCPNLAAPGVAPDGSTPYQYGCPNAGRGYRRP